MTIFIIFAIAFVVWHFIPMPKPAGPQPKFRNEPRARADDPNWRQFIDRHCESPAETAFLTAMVNAYGLLPVDGSLLANGIKVDFQVGEGRYRVDFLANDWLVIEIDGATYHSSPEAKARDAQRDEYFEELGYSILRIPAKVVFNEPREAVRRVRSALAVGKRQIAPSPNKSGLERLGDTFRAANQLISDVNRSVTISAAVQKAMSAPSLTFATEKVVIDSAFTGAERSIKVQEFRSRSEEASVLYDSATRRLEDAIHQREGVRDPGAPTVSAFLRPASDVDPEIEAAITQRFSHLEEERLSFFEASRKRLKCDPRLAPLVEEYLLKLGWPSLWKIIEDDGTSAAQYTDSRGHI